MTDQGTKSDSPRRAGTPSVASRTLTNPPINNHSTPHTTHFTPASALGGVAPPRGGETRKRLDEPTPDQVRGDERRTAPAPAPLRQAQGPGLGTSKKKFKYV